MKRFLFVILFILFSFSVFGQNDGTIKFLGIPIDGPESQFVSKLKSKGFTYNSDCESYKGQFNGKYVDVYIHTNHNLVDRVYVAFPYTDERNIRIEYNILLSQFKNNSKYTSLYPNEPIPKNDDISYEMTVNHKRYQASFSYFDPNIDKISFTDELCDKLSGVLSEEEIIQDKEFLKNYLSLSEEDQKAMREKIIEDMQSQTPSANIDESNLYKVSLIIATMTQEMESMADGEVWFIIYEHFGRYYIGLYYDNLHNKAHGEDL